MARKKRKVPGLNASSTADISFHIAYLLPCDNFNGYGFRFGKTLAAAA